MCDFGNLQIRHLGTHKVGCQPDDFLWSLNFPQGFVWVCMSKQVHFIPPEGNFWYKEQYGYKELNESSCWFLYTELLLYIAIFSYHASLARGNTANCMLHC